MTKEKSFPIAFSNAEARILIDAIVHRIDGFLQPEYTQEVYDLFRLMQNISKESGLPHPYDSNGNN